MAFDTLILNSAIIDGTGRPRYVADLGIMHGRIRAIGSLASAEAGQIIDAVDCVTAPGFIDIHTHSDVSLLDDPGGDSKAHQGVTTEVVGNCGFSPFPAGDTGASTLQREIGWQLPSRLEWDWTTLDGWASRIESTHVSVNVVPLVGHATLRTAVGATEKRSATDSERRAMKRLLAEAMEQGAFGLSTGLTLPPSSYGTLDEIVELAAVVNRFGGFYATHARVCAGGHVKAVEEAVAVGRQVGLPVQYSHMAIIDSRVYGHARDLVNLIERASAEGIDASYDVYPYTAAETNLDQLIPEWVQAGGVSTMLGRLRNPIDRCQTLDDMAGGWFGGLPWEWDKLVISSVHSERNRCLVGQSLADIAVARKAGPAETLLALIDEEDDHVYAVMHNRIEDDVRSFLSHPQAMIGSDGNAISPHGPYTIGKPHPRFYGTYPRILGRYVRDEPLLSLEAAVYKMTGFPARRLGLQQRGRIAEGLAADLVVFDPRIVIDRATFEDPHRYPEGITYVYVDGEPIVAEGKSTDRRPGRVLRRGHS